MVGNKVSDYDENDRVLMEAIADFTAPVLNARLQRDRQERKRRQAEKELQQSYNMLEHRVEKRTAELTKINKELEREIEERRTAEDALRKNEMLLFKDFDGISDPIFLLYENMKIKILNKAAFRYYQKEKKIRYPGHD